MSYWIIFFCGVRLLLPSRQLLVVRSSKFAETESVMPTNYIQLATDRIWTYAQPDFRLCWTNLCSSNSGASFQKKLTPYSRRVFSWENSIVDVLEEAKYPSAHYELVKNKATVSICKRAQVKTIELHYAIYMMSKLIYPATT